MVDTVALGATASRRGGSSPLYGKRYTAKKIFWLLFFFLKKNRLTFLIPPFYNKNNNGYSHCI
jgi:hypothetical protein